jgi:glycerophosphoryl diester phosphodiesterase
MENPALPLVIAHRGASMDGYENSIEAFKLAVEQKADMIELDTHLTRDGYFVIYHDNEIIFDDQKIIIAESSLETISNIRLPNNEPIPLLQEVLEQFLSKIQFNIEIKCNLQIKEFDNLLKEVGGDNSKILVSSFLKNVLYELRSSKLGYGLAYLYILPGLQFRKLLNADFITAMHPFFKLLTTKQVELFQRKRKKVNAWTVNKENDILNLAQKGVDGLITDQPMKTREILERYLK